MKRKLLDYLECPSCGGTLRISTERELEEAEIMAGDLTCQLCHAAYPIIRGVPRFAKLDQIDPLKAATAEGFGFEWQHFTQEDDRYHDQFLGWIDPVKPAFFKDKVVLDVGCGKGRHMTLARDWGAREIIGLDLSDAVEPAFAVARRFENMHVVQADLCTPPLKRGFDYGYSVGVIDHTPEPIVGFQAVASKIKEGGHFSVWVYGAENNEWITGIITPFRERFTSKISPRTLLHLSKIPTAIVFGVSKLIYGPLNRTNGGSGIAKRLFYNDYLNTISKFGWREQHTIVFDHLVAPTASYVSRAEFDNWWQTIEAEDVVIGWHNKNSWRGTGRIAK